MNNVLILGICGGMLRAARISPCLHYSLFIIHYSLFIRPLTRYRGSSPKGRALEEPQEKCRVVRTNFIIHRRGGVSPPVNTRKRHLNGQSWTPVPTGLRVAAKPHHTHAFPCGGRGTAIAVDEVSNNTRKRHLNGQSRTPVPTSLREKCRIAAPTSPYRHPERRGRKHPQPKDLQTTENSM